MKASETKLQKILEGTNQYVIPLYQRTYSWEPKHWNALWNDLTELLAADGPKSHFMGSIVTMPTSSVPEGVAKYLLIDGQQRITTFFILLAALRDRATEVEAGNLGPEIEQTILTNHFKQGLDRVKVLPTHADRDAFLSVVEKTELVEGSPISEAYRFFRRKLQSKGVDQLAAVKQTIVNDLMLVSIILDRDDNPHLIFESLNAKGRTLSQSDLMRNYFFMRVNVKNQDDLFAKYWKPMQQDLGENLTDFMRHFLMKDGSKVRQGEIYFSLKEQADEKTESEVVAMLSLVTRFAKYYAKLLDPSRETNDALRERLNRIRRLDVTTAYPFLLNIYHDNAEGKLSSEGFCSILDAVENFIIRRWVCSVPTNTLNKIFPQLYSQAAAATMPDLVEGTKQSLVRRDYPSDAEFIARLKAAPLYSANERMTRTKLLLERLELAREHKEAVDLSTLSIEHVMPQTLSESWKDSLGDDWEQIHSTWLHTLGNLTLSGYNSNMSNNAYETKREFLSNSNLELNRDIGKRSTWNQHSIEERGLDLAQAAVSVWPHFGNVGAPEVDDHEEESDGPSDSEVLSILGGGKPEFTQRRLKLYRLEDNSLVTIRNSKYYAENNNYWYGLNATSFELAKQKGITHIVFGLSDNGVVKVPLHIVEDYISGTSKSKSTDGSVRHYHCLITGAQPYNLYWSVNGPHFNLESFFVPFNS